MSGDIAFSNKYLWSARTGIFYQVMLYLSNNPNLSTSVRKWATWGLSPPHAFDLSAFALEEIIQIRLQVLNCISNAYEWNTNPECQEHVFEKLAELFSMLNHIISEMKNCEKQGGFSK